MLRSVATLVASVIFTPCLFLPLAAQPTSILYVDPAGQDIPNAGSQSQPFRTISGALQSDPPAGTIIQLAVGTYSPETGETFPLQIPRGVALRGDEATKGNGIIVSGGGIFISPTFARQNIAILPGDNSQISGITLTNGVKRGYGLWVESAQNVSILNNTFTKTSHDGVFLTGTAQANVLGNLFRSNRANGLSAVGESEGEIRENVFEDTGFGLSIGQKSAVVLINNRIVNNRSGIVLSNKTTPKLRGNLIANNREDGIVILKDRVGQPNPDLGTPTDPGQNIFQNNTKKDINNSAQVKLPAFGNQVDVKKVVNIDVSGTAPTSDQSLSNIPKLPPAPIPAPKVPPANAKVVPILRQPNPKALPPGGAAALPPVSGQPGLQTVTINKPTVQPSVKPPTTPMPRKSPVAAAKVYRFRVVVPIESEARTAQLKTIVPDAFFTKRNGKRILQVGAYADQQAADVQVNKLKEAGFMPRIESI